MTKKKKKKEKNTVDHGLECILVLLEIICINFNFNLIIFFIDEAYIKVQTANSMNVLVRVNFDLGGSDHDLNQYFSTMKRKKKHRARHHNRKKDCAIVSAICYNTKKILH